MSKHFFLSNIKIILLYNIKVINKTAINFQKRLLEFVLNNKNLFPMYFQ